MKEVIRPMTQGLRSLDSGIFSPLDRYFTTAVPYWEKKLIRKTVETLTDSFAYPIYVHGIENLDITQMLIANGGKLVMVSNHLSYVDPTVLMAALKIAGYGEIAKNTIPIEGLKLRKNPIRKFLATSHETILVVPPSIIEDANDEEKRKYLLINMRAFINAKRTLQEGHHILGYPETTRSRTQQLINGWRQMAGYLTLVENTFVLPIGISRTEKILPVGAKLPEGNWVDVSFASPIRVADIEDLYPHIPKDPNISKEERKQLEEKRQQMIVDYLMYRIADCLPEKYRGVYSDREIYAKQAA